MTDKSKDECDTGGPAFPHANPCFDGNWDKRSQIGGMSLRDYFAASALPIFIEKAYGLSGHLVKNDDEAARLASAKSYAMADAMIAARTT